MNFLHYELKADILCLGERIKKGTYRPTIQTIPYTQITGALRAYLSYREVHAIGNISKFKSIDQIVYSPRDRTSDVSKLPITVEALSNVVGNIFIKNNGEVFPEEFSIVLGALRTKGFGRSKLKYLGKIDMTEDTLSEGKFNSRIPVEHLDKFMITVIRPVYGFLLKPISPTEAIWVKSIFEDSEIKAPKFLLKEGE